MKKVILSIGVLLAFTITQAQTPNSSISFKKDSNNLFTITLGDPQGIKEFSLEAPNKFPYGGGLSGCPTSFKVGNVSFADPDDFTPAMNGTVTDCKGNITHFEIPAPVNGLTKGKIINAAAEEESGDSTSNRTEEAPKPNKVEEANTLPTTVQYPVPELGGCGSETDCKLYCDDAANAQQCLAFAKKHNLLPKDEVERAEKFLAIGKGPGGCDSQKSCESYCNNVNHIDECVTFAEEHGFISDKELQEAKKFQSIIKSGGTLPGGCADRNSCEIYCNSPENMDECLAFAEKSGLIGDEELGQAKKFIEFMKKGETPGGCRSKEQCENFCTDENHLEECIAFAEKTGFANKEDIEMFRKTGGKGPGGCKGKEQCEAYCQANQEECFNWAQANGMMKEEDLQRMREGMREFRQNLEHMPPEMVECLKNAVGEDVLGKLTNGEPVFARDLGEKMQSCVNNFQDQIMQKFGGERGGPPGESSEGFHDGQLPEGFSGPGGCRSPEECISYCQTNPKECSNFQGPQQNSQGSESFSGPTYEQAETPEQYQQYKQQNQQYEEQYRQQYEEQKNQFEQQYQQQYQQIQQQYQQYPTDSYPTPSYPTSPEEYCKQYPEKCAPPQP